MRQLVKNLLRPIWRRSGARELRMLWRYKRLKAQWVAERLPAGGRVSAQPDGPLIIIPPDPILLVSSKGDEAMITCAIAAVRQRDKNRRIIVATDGDVADQRAARLGIESCRLNYGTSLSDSIKRIMATEPGQVLAIGADVMDGAYNPSFSFENFALIDMLDVRGVPAQITGFSVSKKPFKELGRVFEAVGPDFIFKIRDPDSFTRFQQLSSAKSELVADPAFLLQPDAEGGNVRSYIDWIDARTALGRRVIGFNIHPLLFDDRQRAMMPKLMNLVAEELSAVMDATDVDIALIAHDFRDECSDWHCHIPLKAALASHSDRILDLAEELSAGQLKAVASRLYGVVAGRMHFTIASLGVATPVLGLAYKDKVSGLMKHFGLSGKLTLEVDELLNPGVLRAAILDFLGRCPDLRKQIEAALPAVKDLSKRNFAFLDDV